MNSTLQALLIVASALALFALGWLAGYYEALQGHAPQQHLTTIRIQWEVLLTGLLAILGGVLAYRGATLPARESYARHLLVYNRELNHVLSSFKNLTSRNGPLLYALSKDLYHADSYEEAITSSAKDAFAVFPQIPTEVMSPDLSDLIEKLKTCLFQLSRQTKEQETSIQETRELISQIDSLVLSKVTNLA
jgi:hypothetical protein